MAQPFPPHIATMYERLHYGEFRPWWGDLPGEFVKSIEDDLRDIGYHIAIAGSVAKDGWGRDLDLVIVPTFDSAVSVAEVVMTLAKGRTWELIDTHEYANLRAFQMLVLIDDNRLVDLYIGPEPDPGLRDEVLLDIQIAEEGWGMGC